MREGFSADWAFSIRGILERIVRESFPQYLRQWPLLQSFDFDAYQIDGRYACIILRDKLSGIPNGPGLPKPFPHADFPDLPSRIEDVERWQSYLNAKFELQNEDAAFLVPIHDSQKSSSEDYKLFSEFEKQFWDMQVKYVTSRFRAHLTLSHQTTQPQSVNVIYNVLGQNARVNINSKDSSKNVIDQSSSSVFSNLIEAAEDIEDENKRAQIKRSIVEMEQSCGTDDFAARYKDFMSIAADHITVFAPWLAALASLL